MDILEQLFKTQGMQLSILVPLVEKFAWGIGIGLLFIGGLVGALLGVAKKALIYCFAASALWFAVDKLILSAHKTFGG